MIPRLIDHLIPDGLNEAMDQIPVPVIGIIYPDGRREYRPYSSLEDLYLDIERQDTPLLFLPDYLIMADGSVLVYVHQLFYQVFSMRAGTEPELRELINLSTLLNN